MSDVSRPLAAYTTLRLGGPAAHLVEIVDHREIPRIVRDCAGPIWLIAGGSNVVVDDAGLPGTVLLLRTRGSRSVSIDSDYVTVTVAAGEPWDDVVALAVEENLSGIECLSGIPGSAGATPIQNVGAYGQEVADTLVGVTVYDRARDEVFTMTAEQCGMGYRTSVFKHSDRWIVLDVTFRLRRSPLSEPVRYAELARTLGVRVGERVPSREARAAVLGLRAGKAMLLDDDDHDTWSAGSFFTNPVLDAAAFAALRERASDVGEPPAWPGADGSVKTSAAWLIERAGFTKGYSRAGVAISTRHTLSLTNRGTGTTAALLDLAREIRDGVRKRFEVELRPEPVLMGCEL